MTRRDARGFTLLEVLAALALLAIGFAIGLSALGRAMGNTSRAAALTAATLDAQTLLDGAGLLTPLREGVERGRFDDGMQWELRVRKYLPQQPPAANTFGAPQPVVPASGIDLFQLDLDVHYGAGRVLHLATLRAQAAQQP